MMSRPFTLFGVIVSAFIIKEFAIGVELGKFYCVEVYNETIITTDEKLNGLLLQNCRLQVNETRDQIEACAIKCLLKLIRAIKKNGKPVKEEAKKLVAVVPNEYQEEGKAVFDICYTKFHSKVKKDPKCDSWIPFSSCFLRNIQKLCLRNSSSEAAASENS